MKALGFGGGSLKVGNPADIVLFRTNISCMTPLYNTQSNIVYSAGSNAVDTVFCNGRVLMYDGFIPSEEEICMKASAVAKDLIGRYLDSAGKN